MHHGFHHIKKRKRQNLQHPDSNLALEIGEHPLKSYIFDELAYVVGFVSAFINIPQLVQIWGKQETAGVSLGSWIGFGFVSIFWLTYAIVHKEKALAFAFALTLVFQILIVVGLLIV